MVVDEHGHELVGVCSTCGAPTTEHEAEDFAGQCEVCWVADHPGEAKPPGWGTP